MHRCRCPRWLCWGTQVSVRCERKAAARGAPRPGSQTGAHPLPTGAAGLQWAGEEGTGGPQQGQGGCPGLRGTASPSGAVFAGTMLEFTTAARLSRLPAEPACGCDVPRRLSVCGSGVAHAGPPCCAASHPQHRAAWPEGGLSPTEQEEQERRHEQQCSLQARAAGT